MFWWMSYEEVPCVLTLESADCDFRAADVSDTTIFLTGVKGGARDVPLEADLLTSQSFKRETHTHTHSQSFTNLLKLIGHTTDP